MSYPDKKKTFSRALMSLTPENRFRGAVNLSIPAEDSPGQFVYLVVESEGFREERRIAVTTMSRSQKKESDKFTFWRRRLRSVQSVLTAQQIQDMSELQQLQVVGST
ncbi:hypothetical protein GDO81_019510 [Engystomops pustulosus]|uniref:Complement C3/4/5 macroglobulin domain-containing protein n=1 Tax=Engystomops pustulosus TaxID=76066 RepID=A0AAV6ZFM2_ENGPU|nr:hypothetical protein GDO81_019510 [Engystomops pustulosus]